MNKLEVIALDESDPYAISRFMVPDERLWDMSIEDILELDTTMGINAIHLVMRKMRLIAEASTYMLPRIRAARRRLNRCIRLIEKAQRGASCDAGAAVLSAGDVTGCVTTLDKGKIHGTMEGN